MTIQRMPYWLLAAGVLAGLLLLSFHPGRPLYMAHESVEIVSKDGTVLAGTLSLPRWARPPVPAVVVVHGSGRLTREHLLGDIRRLVRGGFGVLAYDKRGGGDSQGAYPQAGGSGFESVLRLLAQDAAAAFEHLRRSSDVDPSRLGFFGASQAGWIIPLAAEQLDPRPRFHVIISGAAVSTGVEEYYSQLTGDGLRAPQLTDLAEIMKRVESFTGPVGFDPAPILSTVRIPTLWLLGERDESVPTFASVRVLESIRDAGNTSHRVVVYPNVDHSLRNVRTRDPAPLWADIEVWLREIGVLAADGASLRRRTPGSNLPIPQEVTARPRVLLEGRRLPDEPLARELDPMVRPARYYAKRTGRSTLSPRSSTRPISQSREPRRISR